MTNKGKFEIDFENQPFCILEGGLGLNDTEEVILKELQHRSIEHWVIAQLYDMPERLLSIMYLKPKTLIIGTTGTYEEDLKHLGKVFEITEYFPDHVIWTLEERPFGLQDIRKKAVEKHPIIKFWKASLDLSETIKIKPSL